MTPTSLFLQSLMELDHRLQQSIVGDSIDLEQCVAIVLEEARQLLRFQAGEYLSIVTEERRYPKPGEIVDPRNEQWHTLWIAAVNYDQASIELSREHGFVRIADLFRGHRGAPKSLFDPQFGFEPLITLDNADHIRSMERQGRLVSDYLEKMRRVYDTELDAQSFSRGFPEYIYQMFVPATRMVGNRIEMFGLFCFDQPLAIDLNQLPSPQIVAQAKQLVSLIGKAIAFKAYAESIRKERDEKERAFRDLREAQTQLERTAAELRHELSRASDVQRKLFPSVQQLKSLRQVGVEAIWEPFVGVSGDLFDVFATSPDTLHFMLADVTGHGMGAAIQSSLIKIIARWVMEEGESHEILEIARQLNRVICRQHLAYISSFDPKFTSLFAATLSTNDRTLRYINAGHPYPLVIEQAGIRSLDRSDFLLGVSDAAQYSVFETNLQMGDKIVVYSDGLVDAVNMHGEFFGEERLRRTLSGTESGESAQAIRERLIATFRSFTGSTPLTDDVTALIIEIR